MSISKPILYLIPSLLGGDDISVLSNQTLEIIKSLSHFIVENEKTARRFLRKAGFQGDFDQVSMELLNKRTEPMEMIHFLDPMDKGHSIGLLSEAGSPAIADPGANIVLMAYQKNFRVKPLPGPSSIYLALMASGLSGQNFAFHGYLPIDRKEKIRELKRLEHQSLLYGQSQIFMETPYRNDKMLSDIIVACHGETSLCIAVNITQSNEKIRTCTLDEWKKRMPDLHKQPAVFILQKSPV